MTSDRLSIRLGPLQSAVDRICKRDGITRSEMARRAIAAHCKVDEPKLVEGRPKRRTNEPAV